MPLFFFSPEAAYSNGTGGKCYIKSKIACTNMIKEINKNAAITCLQENVSGVKPRPQSHGDCLLLSEVMIVRVYWRLAL